MALACFHGAATFPVYDSGSNVFVARGARATYDAGAGIPNDPEVQAGARPENPAPGSASAAPEAAPAWIS